MVKRNFIIFLLLVLLIQPSFALNPRIVDQEGFLTDEEVQEIETFMEGLETAFKIETAAFFLEDQGVDLRDYIEENYDWDGNRYVYFAYDMDNFYYYVGSSGIAEIDEDVCLSLEEELLDEGHVSGLALLNSFYFKVYELLLPSLGGQTLDIAEEVGEVVGDEPEVEDDYEEEDLVENHVMIYQSFEFWTEEELDMLRTKAEEMAKRKEAFIALVALDEDPGPKTSDYASMLLEEYSDLPDAVAMVVNISTDELGQAGFGRGESILEDEPYLDVLENVVSFINNDVNYGAGTYFISSLQDNLPYEDSEVTDKEVAVLSSGSVYLEDRAELWSPEERNTLLEEAAKLAETYGISVALATTDNSMGKTSEAYIDDMTDEQFGINTDNVGFLIDMQNRRIHISTSGKAIDVLNDNRIEKMLDRTFDQVSDEKYFKAAQVFIKDVGNYFEKEGPNELSATDALAGIGVGGASGLGFFTKTKKKYQKKAKPKNFQYVNNLVGGFSPVRGTLLNKRVTSTKIASSSGGSSGGGSSTHTSSGGGTHGGGGRSF